jgi:hypothetical protein
MGRRLCGGDVVNLLTLYSSLKREGEIDDDKDNDAGDKDQHRHT